MIYIYIEYIYMIYIQNIYIQNIFRTHTHIYIYTYNYIMFKYFPNCKQIILVIYIQFSQQILSYLVRSRGWGNGIGRQFFQIIIPFPKQQQIYLQEFARIYPFRKRIITIDAYRSDGLLRGIWNPPREVRTSRSVSSSGACRHS